MFIVFQMAAEREGSSTESKPPGDEETKEKKEGQN
jgi:hypothetical protein